MCCVWRVRCYTSPAIMMLLLFYCVRVCRCRRACVLTSAGCTAGSFEGSVLVVHACHITVRVCWGETPGGPAVSVAGSTFCCLPEEINTTRPQWGRQGSNPACMVLWRAPCWLDLIVGGWVSLPSCSCAASQTGCASCQNFVVAVIVRHRSTSRRPLLLQADTYID